MTTNNLVAPNKSLDTVRFLGGHAYLDAQRDESRKAFLLEMDDGPLISRRFALAGLSRFLERIRTRRLRARMAKESRTGVSSHGIFSLDKTTPELTQRDSLSLVQLSSPQ